MADKDVIVQVPAIIANPIPQPTPDDLCTFSNTSFVKRFLHNQHIHTLLRDMERTGELIYKPSDILKTTHPLAKLIRIMFVDQRITNKYFEDMHHLFCVSHGDTADKINSDRNNTRKALAKAEPTFPFYEKIHNIFDAHIIDMSATLYLRNGKTVTYQRNKNYIYPHIITICADDIKHMKDPTHGTPIFLARDIDNTTHPIALFIHMYLVHQQISVETFYDIFNTYFEKLHYSANSINAHRNNSVRQYFIDAPTFKAWEKFNTVMGSTLIDLATTVRHKDGTIATYAISDAKRMAELPYGEE